MGRYKRDHKQDTCTYDYLYLNQNPLFRRAPIDSVGGFILGTYKKGVLVDSVILLFLLVPYGYIILKVKKRIPKEMTGLR